MNEITLLADVNNISAVQSFVHEQLEKNGCSPKNLFQIDIAIEEVFTNIASYAYDPDEGTATIRFELTEAPRTMVLKFIDSGTPFNPLEVKDADINVERSKRKIGGLGIFMVKKIMDKLEYSREDNCNILTAYMMM